MPSFSSGTNIQQNTLAVILAGSGSHGFQIQGPASPDTVPSLAPGLCYKFEMWLAACTIPFGLNIGATQVCSLAENPAQNSGGFEIYAGPTNIVANLPIASPSTVVPSYTGAAMTPMIVTLVVRRQMGAKWEVETWIDYAPLSLYPVCIGKQLLTLSDATFTWQLYGQGSEWSGTDATWSQELLQVLSMKMSANFADDPTNITYGYLGSITSSKYANGAGVICSGYCNYAGADFVLVGDEVWDGSNDECVRFFASADMGKTWNESLFSGFDEYGNASSALALFDLSLTASPPATVFPSVIPGINLIRSPALTGAGTATATFTETANGAQTLTIIDSAGANHTISTSGFAYNLAGLVIEINQASGVGSSNGGHWTASVASNAYSSTPSSQFLCLMQNTAAPVNCNGVTGSLNLNVVPHNISLGSDPATGVMLACCARWFDSKTSWVVGRFYVPPTPTTAYNQQYWGPEFIIAGGPMSGAGAGTGGDQHAWDDVRSVLKLADGRWAIGCEIYNFRDYPSTGDSKAVLLISKAGLSPAQIQAAGSYEGYSYNSGAPTWSATPGWTLNGLPSATLLTADATGLGGPHYSVGQEPSVDQMANGQLVAVGRAAKAARLSLGTIDSGTGIVTWADPTDSTNVGSIYGYFGNEVVCDGGLNNGSYGSTNGNQRPFLWSGSAPVNACCDNSSQVPMVYFVTCTKPYAASLAGRFWITIWECPQSAFSPANVAANEGISFVKSSYSVIVTDIGVYPSFKVNNGVLCGAMGNYVGSHFFRGKLEGLDVTYPTPDKVLATAPKYGMPGNLSQGTAVVVTPTYPNVNKVFVGVTFGDSTTGTLTGTYYPPNSGVSPFTENPALVLSGAKYGGGNAVSGTYVPPSSSDPGVQNVLYGTHYVINGSAFSGAYYPPNNGLSPYTDDPSLVLQGAVYGYNRGESGTASTSGGSSVDPGIDNVLYGTSYVINGSPKNGVYYPPNNGISPFTSNASLVELGAYFGINNETEGSGGGGGGGIGGYTPQEIAAAVWGDSVDTVGGVPISKMMNCLAAAIFGSTLVDMTQGTIEFTLPNGQSPMTLFFDPHTPGSITGAQIN